VDGPLEVLIATHMDADHIGGLSAVLSAYKVLNVWDNGSTSTSATYNRFKAAILSSGTVEHIGRRGNTITAGFMAFTVLNPVDTTGTSNNNSIVLKLNYGNVSFQFEGDAEQEAESSMLAAGLLSHVDFLKVGHHGSSTASSSSFLKATSPTVAVYMAGVGNSYGHPHPETITALTQIGAIIYGTDKHGTIEIKTDGKVYNLSASRSPTTTVVQSTVQTIPTITTVSTTTPKTTTTAITTTTITTTTTTTQPYTTTTTTPQTSSSETVYITNTGTKYHRAGCRYLSSSSIPISKAEAIARGLTPCSVCNP